MSPQVTIRPLNTFLLVDATKTSRKYALACEDLVRSFKEHYEQGSLIAHQTITLPQYLAAEQPLPYRCDLGDGFKQVLDSLPDSSEAQNEVFVFLQVLPGGDWMAPLSELAVQRNVWIHIFWLVGNDPKFDLKDVKTMGGFDVDLRGFLDQGEYINHIARVLELRTGHSGWSPRGREEPHPGITAAATPGPEATPTSGETAHSDAAIVVAGLAGQTQGTIQTTPPAGKEEPRSLQIFAPPQKPAEVDSAEPELRPRVTIPLEKPLTEPQLVAAKVEKIKASSQPTSSTEAQKTGAKESLPEEPAAPSEPVEQTKAKPPAEAGMVSTEIAESKAPTLLPVEAEKPVQQPVPKVEPEPPVGKDGVASNWKNLEPPADWEDRVEHSETKRLEAGENWLMAAASRRGKMHAHQGIFREDAFGLGCAEGWNFVIVADGGGSRPLARVGSKVAAEAGITAMIEEARNQAKGSSSLENICSYILQNAIRKAYDAIRKEAQNRERKIDDFGTTFLALAHRPMDDRHLLGTLQVGDGLIAAMFHDRPPLVLADPDVGESASQTLFITSKPWNEWIVRVKVYDLELEPAMLVCMCDGVSDDLIPYKTNLPPLFALLSDKVSADVPEEALLDFLGYDKRGSFDDRTLAVVFPRQMVKPSTPPAAEETGITKTDQTPVEGKVEEVKASREKKEPSREKKASL